MQGYYTTASGKMPLFLEIFENWGQSWQLQATQFSGMRCRHFPLSPAAPISADGMSSFSNLSHLSSCPSIVHRTCPRRNRACLSPTSPMFPASSRAAARSLLIHAKTAPLPPPKHAFPVFPTSPVPRQLAWFASYRAPQSRRPVAYAPSGKISGIPLCLSHPEYLQALGFTFWMVLAPQLPHFRYTLIPQLIPFILTPSITYRRLSAP